MRRPPSHVRLLPAGLRLLRPSADRVTLTLLTQRCNNGPVEGFVHKLKPVKRQGYGRANFGLLRASILAA